MISEKLKYWMYLLLSVGFCNQAYSAINISFERPYSTDVTSTDGYRNYDTYYHAVGGCHTGIDIAPVPGNSHPNILSSNFGKLSGKTIFRFSVLATRIPEF